MLSSSEYGIMQLKEIIIIHHTLMIHHVKYYSNVSFKKRKKLMSVTCVLVFIGTSRCRRKLVRRTDQIQGHDGLHVVSQNPRSSGKGVAQGGVGGHRGWWEAEGGDERRLAAICANRRRQGAPPARWPRGQIPNFPGRSQVSEIFVMLLFANGWEI